MYKKVCILTSVHYVFDTRIFHKQAKSLVEAGYNVILIAQHDRDEIMDGVRVLPLPKPKNRFRRMLGTWRVFKLARKQRADVYHFHDPELIPIAVLLRLFTNGKLIYDVHENVKHDILGKLWLPRAVRKLVSLIYQLTEKLSFPFINLIIIAEDSYINNYRGQNKVLPLRNYPVLSLVKGSTEAKDLRPSIIYVGGIAEVRGVWELIESIRLLRPKYGNILLILVGWIHSISLKRNINKFLEEHDLQQNINLVGKVKHEEVYELMPRCHIGMGVVHPTPNLIESRLTKLYEYMAVGLPVIASNFPVYQELIGGNNCGLTVDPQNIDAIAEAVEYLIRHPSEAKKMGENGRKAVVEKYNWETESKKLIDV
jgi:glycosyltransferase involved in cell wall biosynthesis